MASSTYMNEKLFPKPRPANPVSLEKWLRRTDRAETGREPFFRGRDDKYKVFQDAVTSLNDGFIGGGTMIFQGAPGSGKTALMQECMEAVRQHSTPNEPWVAVNIKPENLESAAEVVVLLIEAINQEGERLSKILSGSSARKLESIMEIGRKVYHDLSERGFGIAGISVGRKSRNDQEAIVFSQRLFQNAAGLLKNFHIVAFVDEAQNTPVGNSTKGVMSCLHDPPDKIPLLAAFFGLSDTESRLSECGISRPADQRVVNLELLDYEESCDVIRSVFNAYEFTGSREEREIWVNRMAKLSQGWPQHINRIAVAASHVIVEHGGKIKSEWLDQALHNAQGRKEDYYRMILRRCSGQSWIYKQLALATDHNDGLLNIDQIFNIAQHAKTKCGEPVKDFPTDALHAGVLMESRDRPGNYYIPIPSLGDFLRKLPDNPPPDTGLT
ncbi:MAG: ATP-binding protein [Gammaproteobacteria bacterium]|nr:ATP-binding protein [Gammaproteobacteria bacterium]